MPLEKSKNKKKPKNEPAEMKFISGKVGVLLVFLLSFFLYANTLKHKYALDDDIYTLKNVYVQKGISSLPDLLKYGSLKGFDGSNVADYRPVTLISFALEKSLFGNSAESGHLINVLLYAILCCLLFTFIRLLLKNYHAIIPFFITLLFVFHPIHTEVVANIKSRDEILCMLFGILSLKYLFMFTSGSKKNSHLIFGFVSFFLCLMCKENGFVFLGLIPLMLWFFTDIPGKKIAGLSMTFIAIAGLAVLIRASILDSLLININNDIMNNSLAAAKDIFERTATVSTIYLKNLIMLIFPANLSFDYSYNQLPIVSWSNPLALISLLIHVALLIYAFINFRKKDILSFCILFYFISTVVTSNLFFLIGTSFADRFLFTPSLAFCIAIPVLVWRIINLEAFKSTTRKLSKLMTLFIAIVCLYGFKTVDRNKDWENNDKLFRSGLITSPNSFRVHYGFANACRTKSETSILNADKIENAKLAIGEYERTIEIFPEFSQAHYNLGVIYLNMSDTTKAAGCFKRAIDIKPTYAEALNNYGIVYFGRKDYENALIYFKRAVDSDPKNFPDTYGNVGVSYQILNKIDSALYYYDVALKMNPANVTVLGNLSILYNSKGDTAKANFYRAEAEKYRR